MKPEVTAIILSAGKGRRMGADIPKQYMEAGGKPLLYYCLKAFVESCADSVIIVCGSGDEDYVRKEIAEKYDFNKVCDVVSGGAERYDSVLSGLKKAAESGIPEDAVILIHDGARPFVTAENIEDVARATETFGAAVAAVPVKDTIKISDDEGFVQSTTERSRTWQIQTPQGFKFGLILKAYEELKNKDGFDGVTDDAMVLEKVFPDIKVKLVDCGYENFKVTTPEDLTRARQLLK